MNEKYYAGAYWGARKESPADCARRLEVLLTSLPTVDPSFTRWFRQGKSRKAALQRPIEPQREELEKLVLKGKDRVFEDLGFRLSGWNGETDDYDASGFDITCGGYTDAVNNFCFFQLPGRGPNAERVVTAPVLRGLVRSMAIAWEPDCALATSSAHRDLVAATPKPGTFVAWVMYLSARRGTVPPLPTPVHVEPVEGKGTLIVLTPERFTASNPGHVALAAQVKQLLDREGLLAPLQP